MPAPKAQRDALDATIKELVDLAIQRYSVFYFLATSEMQQYQVDFTILALYVVQIWNNLLNVQGESETIQKNTDWSILGDGEIFR